VNENKRVAVKIKKVLAIYFELNYQKLIIKKVKVINYCISTH